MALAHLFAGSWLGEVRVAHIHTFIGSHLLLVQVMLFFAVRHFLNGWKPVKDILAKMPYFVSFVEAHTVSTIFASRLSIVPS